MSDMGSALLEAGYRPKGSNSGNFLNKIVRFMQQQQDTQKKLQDDLKKKADMYQTLRESGYDSKSAYDAVAKGTMPSGPGGETIKEQQAKLEMGKTTAETAKINAELGLLPEQTAERQARIDKIQTDIAKINQDMQGSTDILETKEKQTKIDKLQAEITKINEETSLLGTKKKDRTEAEKFRDDIKLVKAGEISWEDLEDSYPDKVATIGKLQKQLTPVEKSPLFKEGWGLEAKLSTNVAKMTPNAKNMISQIKTQAQLDEFLEDVDKKIADGSWTLNDKNTVLEYFGLR